MWHEGNFGIGSASLLRGSWALTNPLRVRQRVSLMQPTTILGGMNHNYNFPSVATGPYFRAATGAILNKKTKTEEENAKQHSRR